MDRDQAPGGPDYAIRGDQFVVLHPTHSPQKQGCGFAALAMLGFIGGIVGTMLGALPKWVEHHFMGYMLGCFGGVFVGLILDALVTRYTVAIDRSGRAIIRRWRLFGLVGRSQRRALEPDDAVILRGETEFGRVRCDVRVGRTARVPIADGLPLGRATALAQAVADFAGLAIDREVPDDLAGAPGDAAQTAAAAPTGELPPTVAGARACELVDGGVVRFPPFRPSWEMTLRGNSQSSGSPLGCGLVLLIAGVALTGLAVGAVLSLHWWRWLPAVPAALGAWGLWNLGAALLTRWEILLDPRDGTIDLLRRTPAGRSGYRLDGRSTPVITLHTEEAWTDDSGQSHRPRMYRVLIGAEHRVAVCETSSYEDARAFAAGLAAGVGMPLGDETAALHQLFGDDADDG